MTRKNFEQYASEVVIKTLNVKLVSYILTNPDAFVQDMQPLLDCFTARFDVCEVEVRKICQSLRQLIVQRGVVGLRKFRDELQAELQQPVRFIDTVN